MNGKGTMQATLLLLASFAANAYPLMEAMHREASQPVADVADDALILQHVYEQLHPGLYRYNSPDATRANFEKLHQDLGAASSLAEAYLALSRFTATVRCGHTYANFYNQSESVQKALFQQPNRVPFYFVWIRGTMVVTQDFTEDHRLPRGTEVITINGINTQTLLSQLMTVARADGDNNAKRVALMQVQGLDAYESFDIYVPLLFPAIGQDQTLTIRRPGRKQPEQVTVHAETYAQRLSHRPVKSSATAGWTLTFPREDLAVLNMPTWALYNSNWDWKGFISASFAQVQQHRTRVLVIDLRGNEGGLDVGADILSHLVDHATDVSSPERLVRYRHVPTELRPYLHTWDPSFFDLGADAQDRNDGFYALKPDDDGVNAGHLTPASPHFDGRVYVIVDATNSSATFQFAQIVQQLKLATLVGQSTGGNKRGINGGAFFFVRLPHSGIEVDLPLVATVPPQSEPDEGVTPDLPIERTADDIRVGRDPEMDLIKRIAFHNQP